MQTSETVDQMSRIPSLENGWHWGGPSPASHRYRHVLRDSPEVTWCYQSDDNFYASSAAYIFVANDPDPYGSGYNAEDAAHWFRAACKMGIVFG